MIESVSLRGRIQMSVTSAVTLRLDAPSIEICHDLKPALIAYQRGTRLPCRDEETFP